MPWLDSSEDVSRLLRGSIHGDWGSPVAARGEPFFELLLLVVIFGFSVALLVIGVTYLWQYRLAISDSIVGAVVQRVQLMPHLRDRQKFRDAADR